MQLSHEFSVNGSENSDPCQLLKLFGENREPNALEVLIYFAQRILIPSSLSALTQEKLSRARHFLCLTLGWEHTVYSSTF